MTILIKIDYRGDADKFTLEELMGVTAYKNYTRYFPDPWNDGFVYGTHTETPYNAGPFQYGSLKVL